jgi:hypothetical protein
LDTDNNQSDYDGIRRTNDQGLDVEGPANDALKG